ncbi:hypothetical protein [Winogradskyella bathintestinalis]|uniref:Uncharacterized protein n=1 Tax=Winogradskyella bathintestinalis TaxID=3035208 RepID=A0ABT7ZRP9_9FLAO|nr:hypothetical protein [Winogradskyella bathintestinalis]MDN3491484.1 hypothetical protein [Winogradskyella bathintestinalis]
MLTDLGKADVKTILDADYPNSKNHIFFLINSKNNILITQHGSSGSSAKLYTMYKNWCQQ